MKRNAGAAYWNGSLPSGSGTVTLPLVSGSLVYGACFMSVEVSNAASLQWVLSGAVNGISFYLNTSTGPNIMYNTTTAFKHFMTALPLDDYTLEFHTSNSVSGGIAIFVWAVPFSIL